MGGVFARRETTSEVVETTFDASRRQSYRTLVSQYGGRCDWLKNDQFLRDLEGDSVDAEILDEELRLLHEQQPKTCRGKTARVLETSPLQIAMCVLVLIDTGVVIAEILLDLHAMRSQQRAATSDLTQAMIFLKGQYPGYLGDYNGEGGIGNILDKIKQNNYAVNGNASSSSSSAVETDFMRSKRQQAFPQLDDDDDDKWTSLLNPIPSQFESGEYLEGSSRNQDEADQSWAIGVPSTTSGHSGRPATVDYPLDVGPLPSDVSGLIPERKRRRFVRRTQNDQNKDSIVERVVTRTPFAAAVASRDPRDSVASRDPRDSVSPRDPIDNSSPPNVFVYAEPDDRMSSPDASADGERSELVAETVIVRSHDNEKDAEDGEADDHLKDDETFTIKNAYADKLLKIAHILHYGSIAILGIFVIQVFLKVFGMGPEFFKNKLEVFDGVVIMASFTIDLIFVEGITGTEGEEAIALIIIFLLWRILRVINGIMVTAKKRQEFRIKLQKRACRRVEKKLECLDDELSWKEKEIQNLKNLCLRKGASEEDVGRCRPKRSPFFAKMDTSAGLSSIASLSLGFTMSMRSTDSRMRLPLARSLVSLSGHRQTVHDVHSSSVGTPSTSLTRSGQWGPRSRKPSTSTVRSSAADDRSPLPIRQQLTESRSMEKIAEERPRHQLGLSMISSSTSMQSLVANSTCPVSSSPLGTLPTHSDRVSAAAAASYLSAAGSSSLPLQRPPVAAESGGVSDIYIVISDANGGLTPTKSVDERDTSNQASPSSDDERKPSPSESVQSNAEQTCSRSVQFYVETPPIENMSTENLSAAATVEAKEVRAGDSGCCFNEFSSPSTSSGQTVNGPGRRLPSPPAATDHQLKQLQQREASGSLASRWLSKLRKSTKGRAHHENQVATSSDRVRRKPVWVSPFAQTKDKKTKETFL